MSQAYMLDVKVKNSTGEPIEKVYFYHQYGNKCSDIGCVLDTPITQGQEEKIGQATFMAGMGLDAMSRDTWWVQFDRAGQTFASETDFQCTIKEDDGKNRHPVVLEVAPDGLMVHLSHDDGDPCKADVKKRKTEAELNASK